MSLQPLGEGYPRLIPKEEWDELGKALEVRRYDPFFEKMSCKHYDEFEKRGVSEVEEKVNNLLLRFLEEQIILSEHNNPHSYLFIETLKEKRDALYKTEYYHHRPLNFFWRDQQDPRPKQCMDCGHIWGKDAQEAK